MHLNSGFIQPWVGYILLTEIMCVEHYQNRIQNVFLFMKIFYIYIYQDNCTPYLYILGQLHPLYLYILGQLHPLYLYLLGQLHPLPIYIRTSAPPPPPYFCIRTTTLPSCLDFKSKSKSTPCLLPSCSQLTFPLFPLLI